jgi:hypothetical protein
MLAGDGCNQWFVIAEPSSQAATDTDWLRRRTEHEIEVKRLLE